MFGPKIYIKIKDIGVTLAPYKREFCEKFAEMSSSANVRMYSGGPYATTVEAEQETYDSISKNKTSVMWGLFPDGCTDPIGYTGIHGISYDGSCSTEIMIADQSWWGKGIAYQSHLARTLYATEHLNRNIIYASVAEKNTASLKALQKIGYFVTGKRIRQYYRSGEYSDGLTMAWINPARVTLLYPNGIPAEIEQYLQIASDTLKLARENCKFL